MKYFLGFMMLCSLFCLAQERILLKDLGLRANSGQNATPLVNQAIRQCLGKGPCIIGFEKGRYDFWPHPDYERHYIESNTTLLDPRRCAILIEGAADLTLDGNGAEFIFHDRIQPISIDGSNRIKITSLSIDWAIPMGIEAIIGDVAPDWVELQIDPQNHPYRVVNGRLIFDGEGWQEEWGRVKWNDPMEFDPKNLMVVPGTGDEVCLGDGWEGYRAVAQGPGIVRIHHPFKRQVAKGNLLLLRIGARDHAGVFINESRDIFIDDLAMYSNVGLGFLAQYSENISFHRVFCVPNPARRKILSGHDDGFHFSNCRGEITLDECRCIGLMDDSVNVHGTYVLVKEVQANKRLLCQFLHHQSVGLPWARPGDSLSFVNRETMQPIGNAQVATFKALDNDRFELSIQGSLPSDIAPGSAIENLTWTPNLTIRNCFFGNHRARGVLVSTPGKVVIEGNTFESSGCAILIPGDANHWYESGPVRDVLIRGNTFRDSCLTSLYQYCEGIISIMPQIPRIDSAGSAYHRNIRIEGNRFNPFDYPILYAQSVAGLIFSGNTIVRSQRFQPFHARKSTLTFDHCRSVTVGDNGVDPLVLGRNLTWTGSSRVELSMKEKESWTIEGDK